MNIYLNVANYYLRLNKLPTFYSSCVFFIKSVVFIVLVSYAQSILFLSDFADDLYMICFPVEMLMEVKECVLFSKQLIKTTALGALTLKSVLSVFRFIQSCHNFSTLLSHRYRELQNKSSIGVICFSHQ